MGSICHVTGTAYGEITLNSHKHPREQEVGSHFTDKELEAEGLREATWLQVPRFLSLSPFL
jgi:hypothetical protein